jgi:hypothetical protein
MEVNNPCCLAFLINVSGNIDNKTFVKNKRGNYILPPEVSTHFYFYLQSLKCDTLPPQTFKLWQFNPFSLFIPKMPSSHFFKKKNPKKQKTATPWGAYIYIIFVFVFFLEFFLLKKKVLGAFWK